MKSLFSALSLLLLAAVVGCSDDTQTPADSGLSTVAVTVGSTFTYQTIQTDTLDHRIDSTKKTAVHTVLNDKLSVRGKTNVFAVERMMPDKTDIMYVSYAANGNIFVFIGDTANTATNWIELGVGSATSTTANSSVTVPGFGTIPVQITTTYNGVESIMVDGKSMNVVKIKLSTSALGSEQIRRLWISRPLGYIVKDVTEAYAITSVGMRFGGSIDSLTAYVKK